MALVYGVLIIIACHLAGWFWADFVRRDGDWQRWTALAYAAAIGVLCAVVW